MNVPAKKYNLSVARGNMAKEVLERNIDYAIAVMRKKVLIASGTMARNIWIEKVDEISKNRAKSDLVMPMGKFKGQKVDSLPNWYLMWFKDNMKWDYNLIEIQKYILLNLNFIKH